MANRRFTPRTVSGTVYHLTTTSCTLTHATGSACRPFWSSATARPRFLYGSRATRLLATRRHPITCRLSRWMPQMPVRWRITATLSSATLLLYFSPWHNDSGKAWYKTGSASTGSGGLLFVLLSRGVLFNRLRKANFTGLDSACCLLYVPPIATTSRCPSSSDWRLLSSGYQEDRRYRAFCPGRRLLVNDIFSSPSRRPCICSFNRHFAAPYLPGAYTKVCCKARKAIYSKRHNTQTFSYILRAGK